MRFPRWTLALAVLWLLTVPVRAETYVFHGSESASVGDGWQSFLDALPEDAARELDTLDPENPDASLDLLSELSSPASLWTRVKDTLSAAMPDLGAKLVPLFALLLLSAAARAAFPPGSGSLGESLSRVFRLGEAVTVFGVALGALSLTRSFLSTLTAVMRTLVPVMEGICLMGGNLTERQVASAGMLLVVTLTGEVASGILTPATGLLLGLTAVASSCREAGIGTLTAGIKKVVLTLWQTVTLVFSFLLGAQSVLARSADTLAARGAKFAVSTLIPVAGGVLAEALGTLRAGVSVLRTTAGIGGILAVLFLLLPGLLPLLLTQLSLSLASSAAEILGLPDLSGMLGQAKGILELLSAFALYSSMLFLFALTLFAGLGGRSA